MLLPENIESPSCSRSNAHLVDSSSSARILQAFKEREVDLNPTKSSSSSRFFKTSGATEGGRTKSDDVGGHSRPRIEHLPP